MRPTSTTLPTALALAPTALLLGACGGDGGAGGAARAQASDAPAQITASVQAKNESGMQGHVMVTAEEDQTIVKLEVLGLKSGTRYPAHLHRGTCAEGGEVVAELDPPTVASVGLGSSLTHLEPHALEDDRSYFVQVHRPDGTPVACADVRGGGDSSG